MNVLAWTSYGAVRVMAAETPLHFEKIRQAIVDATEEWGIEDELHILHEGLGTCLSAGDARREMLRFIKPHLHNHETFEGFDFAIVED
jgi:hypothetical protein